MLSIQHVMITCLACEMDENYLEKHLGAVVFPDAIRAYSGSRALSHFEKSSNGKDVSWWKFPNDMKNTTRESVRKSLKEASHLAAYQPCVIGEETDIEKFKDKNLHLSPEMYEGILNHLIQDKMFDEFIRKKIDCTDKYQDLFVFDESVMNGKEMRDLIAEIEQEGICVLAHMIYEKTGVICNQDWIQSYVKPLLERAYPMELVNITVSYMKIAPSVNEQISNQDWKTFLNPIISDEEYRKFYSFVVGAMKISN